MDLIWGPCMLSDGTPLGSVPRLLRPDSQAAEGGAGHWQPGLLSSTAFLCLLLTLRGR